MTTAPPFDQLADWLAWMEQLHPEEIAPGLERTGEVYARLPQCEASLVITVAGTNGKGSVIALLESVLLAAGLTVGSYTSPHLLNYNERVRINGREVSDAVLCEAFKQVEQHRDGVPLTYFEYGTLGALAAFAALEPALDVLLLEVGLGGRLDAVNVVDADVAVVTSVSLDHTEWLGDDREAIGFEKAGIFRHDRPGICGDRQPPTRLEQQARKTGAQLSVLGRDFDCARHGDSWRWQGDGTTLEHLPLPGLTGSIQIDNAAVVLQVLAVLRERLPVTLDAVQQGLARAELAGRMQHFPGDVEELLDVAHNRAAAETLADSLAEQPAGRLHTVLAMLSDKDVEGVVEALDSGVHAWFVAGLAAPRGLASETLARRLKSVSTRPVEVFADVAAARAAAFDAARPGDRVLVTGSFYSVAEALRQRV